MGNSKFKIFLKESSNQNHDLSWWLQEENQENKADVFVPSKEYLAFTLKELQLIDGLEISTYFDEENKNDRDVTKRQGVILAIMNIKKDYNNRQIIMFGSGGEINEYNLYINKIENPNENPICTVKDNYTGNGLNIRLTLMPAQFDYIAGLIKINRLERLELELLEPPGFYSSPNSDFIKVLPNSKELEVVTPENCKIKPPRLGKSYFTIYAYRHDNLTKVTEENASLEKEYEKFPEYKEILEKILNRLDSLEKYVGLPLWLFVGAFFGAFIMPWIIKVGSVIKEIIFNFFS
ncbi:hypothetical protein ACFORL_11645 [Legionella dresdenensis]|uniref:Ankyrin repeat protein n=1 Tax=Legionella dresdenensis TaxID=450200 RepID=A0ABV8CHG7_9GAMM